MNRSKVFGTVAATTLSVMALATTATTANAFSVGGHLNGQEFDDLKLDIPWAAETRIGLAGTGEKEINIHDRNNNAQNRVDVNYDGWVSGKSVNFSLMFDNLANTLTYVVDGVTVSKTSIFENNFSDLYIRTRAAANGSSILVDNLFLSDAKMSSAIGATSSAACLGGVGCSYNDAEYLHIKDIVGNFTLTGRSTMSWSGSKPTRSNLAYQIKLVEGEPVTVPEPAALSLFSLGLVGLLAARKQR